MIVVCNDGTTFQCEGYEITEAGLMLFGGQPSGDGDDERYGSDQEQIGYVPHTELKYVLPDGTRPQHVPAQQAAQAQQPVNQAATGQAATGQAATGQPATGQRALSGQSFGGQGPAGGQQPTGGGQLSGSGAADQRTSRRAGRQQSGQSGDESNRS